MAGDTPDPRWLRRRRHRRARARCGDVGIRDGRIVPADDVGTDADA